MKLKIIFVIIQLHLSIHYSNAQNVNLTVHIDGAKDSTEIWFCRSIDGDPINYCGMYESIKTINQDFKREIYVSDISIINIMPGEYSPKISVVCEKRDSIKLKITKTDNNLYNIQFEGSNAEGQSFIYWSALFHNFRLIPILSSIIEDVLKNKISLKKVTNKLDNITNKLFSKADGCNSNFR